MDISQIEPETQAKMVERLKDNVTPERWVQMERFSTERTRYVSMTLEDIYQSHNAAAVLRSCEALGVQDVHVIEIANKLNLTQSTVSKGAVKWLDLHYYKNTPECYENLRKLGYKVAATAISENGIPPEDIPLDQPVAIVLGNELHGLSKEAVKEADYCIELPMHGFVQSYNLSVCGALCMNTLLTRLRNSDIQWRLSDTEVTALRLKWLSLCVNGWERRIEDLL